MASIASLPTELLVTVFSLSGAESLGRLEQTCKAWRGLCSTSPSGPLVYQQSFHYSYNHLTDPAVRLRPHPDELLRLCPSSSTWSEQKCLLAGVYLRLCHWQRPQEGPGRPLNSAPVTAPLETVPMAYSSSGIDASGLMYIFGGWLPDNQANKAFLTLQPTAKSLQIEYHEQGEKANAPFRTALCAGGEEFDFAPTDPPERAGMTSVSLVAYGVILAFMGQTFDGAPRSAHNDMLLFDTKSRRWFVAPTRGQTPPARAWVTATLSSDKRSVVVFGGGYFTSGWDQAGLFGDVRVFDLRTLAWTVPPTTGPAPEPRAGHVAGCFGDKLVVMLGGNLGGTQVFGDAFSLSLRSWRWKPLNFSGPEGVTPPAMGSSSSFTVGDSMYVIFGWKGANQPTSHAIYALDWPTKSWSRVMLLDSFVERSAMAAELVGGKLVMAFGISASEGMLDDIFFATPAAAPPNTKLLSFVSKDACNI